MLTLYVLTINLFMHSGAQVAETTRPFYTSQACQEAKAHLPATYGEVFDVEASCTPKQVKE
jgi:hypothetical protein